MDKKIELDKKVDVNVTSTRPDLEVSFKPIPKPGSFIVKDGKPVPNLNDAPMAAREELKLKAQNANNKNDSKK